MTKTLNSPIGDQRSELAYLYELEYSTGTLRLTNASRDLVYASNTYTAVGGLLIHDGVNETHDRNAQGVKLELSGVDQTVISTILSADFRNRPARLWQVHFDPDTGAMGTPDLIFRGLQSGAYEVNEQVPEDRQGRPTLRVTTRITSLLAELSEVRPVLTNVTSHNAMLERAGVASPNDRLFERVPSLISKAIYWGTPYPQLPGGRNTGYGDPGGEDETKVDI